MIYEINELIDSEKNLLETLSHDKDVKEKKWWLDQRARLSEAIDDMETRLSAELNPV